MAEIRDQVFISYSHKDTEFMERLIIHLKPYEKKSQIVVWSDNKIKPGKKWEEEIEQALQRAAVAVLLVSADFLASDFITGKELPRLLEAAQNEGVRILSIILKPCAFTGVTSISKFQAINDPNKPLITMDEAQKEQSWVNLCKAIQESMDEFRAQALAVKMIESAMPTLNRDLYWEKVATLFWLGNDLMWIQDMAYRMAPPERLLEGIHHAIEYAGELGFSNNTALLQELSYAKDILVSLVGFVSSNDEKRGVLDNHYRTIVQKVQVVKWIISAMAELEQPGFQKLRAI